jgi:tol-pal system protein YbgF
MTSRRLFGLALVAGLCLLTASPRAQSREQMQLMADLRIVQEQAQQLRLAVGQLSEQMKTLATTLTEQASGTNKQTADALALVREMQRTVEGIGNQMSANTLQVQRFKDEIESLRKGQSLLQQQQSQILQQLLAISAVAPQRDPGTEGAVTTPPPPPPGTPPLPSSPESLYNQAYYQYIQQQWPLAIDGFEELIQLHPQSSWAPEAQYWIGMSYSNQGKHEDAVKAFATVIANYPSSEKVAGAYYRQAHAYEQLKQRDAAIKNYQLIRDKYPNSTEAIQAAAALKRLGVGGELVAAIPAKRQ